MGAEVISQEPIHECYKCEEELVFDVKIGRLDTCPNCESYLHCCRNCRFWSPGAHNQCLESQGEFIRDREVGNFCGHFQFRLRDEDEQADEAATAKARLDALFGGGAEAKESSPWDKTSQARASLDALFKK